MQQNFSSESSAQVQLAPGLEMATETEAEAAKYSESLES